MTEKVYATGSTFPPVKGDTLRLYSNRFCPFAERTRLVLAHLNIPHEVVNIHLKTKPEWYFGKNPLGLVPALEKGNTIVYESAICDEYLDEVYGKQSLLTTDPAERARQKILMERFSKVGSTFYALLLQKGDEQKQTVENILKGLDVFESSLTSHFFGGDTVKMIDYHIWPWFERIPMVKKLGGIDLLPSNRFPKVTAWMARMNELPAVKASELTTDVHSRFIAEGFLKGNMPDYDIGLEE